jgi:hypothetical protein
MSARGRAIRSRRAWPVAAVVAAAILLPACDGNANVSVGVGVAVPAPWGGVRVGAAMPVGPYTGGRYGPMW